MQRLKKELTKIRLIRMSQCETRKTKERGSFFEEHKTQTNNTATLTMPPILDLLNTEMLSALILAPYLSEASELGRVSLVCHQFRRAAEDDSVWHQTAKNRYGEWLTAVTKRCAMDSGAVQQYSNWKIVLKDDNAKVAMQTLKMPQTALRSASASTAGNAVCPAQG